MATFQSSRPDFPQQRLAAVGSDQMRFSSLAAPAQADNAVGGNQFDEVAKVSQRPWFEACAAELVENTEPDVLEGLARQVDD